jgi:hypothetical protein
MRGHYFSPWRAVVCVVRKERAEHQANSTFFAHFISPSRIALERACRPDWLPPTMQIESVTLPPAGLSPAEAPNRTGPALGIDA